MSAATTTGSRRAATLAEPATDRDGVRTFSARLLFLPRFGGVEERANFRSIASYIFCVALPLPTLPRKTGEGDLVKNERTSKDTATMDKLQLLNDHPLPFAKVLGLKFVAASDTGRRLV